ncbi:cobalamin B12-binding domain-containing protein, partial [Candidatus Bathyarchaeota archaeon]|nr:cobalamin B12-binding domain-containing protein [Candidatus Bathyarchaeota archaeon]
MSAGWEALIWNGDLAPAGKENQYSPEMSGYQDYLAADKYSDGLQVWLDLRELLKDYKPDVVGITVRTPAYNSFKNCVRIIREELPSARVIAGGPHISALPDEPSIDRAFVGEGEIQLMAYLGVPFTCFDGWPARGKVYN